MSTEDNTNIKTEQQKKGSTPRAPRLKVEITPEIIARSTQANSRACMIAEAIKEAFPAAKGVSVDLQTCRFTDLKRGLRYVYLTPRVGQKPLIEFDQGIMPTPFNMVLKNAQVVKVRGHKPVNKSEARLAEASLRSAGSGTSVRRTGGRPPPQMRTLRRFGIKAFQGFGAPAAQDALPQGETE